jgi:hypothetical protein
VTRNDDDDDDDDTNNNNNNNNNNNISILQRTPKDWEPVVGQENVATVYYIVIL